MMIIVIMMLLMTATNAAKYRFFLQGCRPSCSVLAAKRQKRLRTYVTRTTSVGRKISATLERTCSSDPSFSVFTYHSNFSIRSQSDEKLRIQPFVCYNESCLVANTSDCAPRFVDGSCDHVVSEAAFRVFHNGADGISRIDVHYKLVALKSGTVEFGQRFSVSFVWASTNGTEPLKPTDGDCISPVRRSAVKFRYNVRTGCLLWPCRFPNCSVLQDALLGYVTSTDHHVTHVASFGNANSSRVDGFVPVLVENSPVTDSTQAAVSSSTAQKDFCVLPATEVRVYVMHARTQHAFEASGEDSFGFAFVRPKRRGRSSSLSESSGGSDVLRQLR
ncbi:hypothetical protein HPB51_012482 [Rhipicephalus microplus]|uniref:Tectonic-1-3 domain-containing protein n=1 Tax=Rhipicephalus microplus TaxID=6941 RepID=A0A9J6E9K7_RHIMP|nr:hypothetical protein HPB51_012482 [Rhipicephalus microplus]